MARCVTHLAVGESGRAAMTWMPKTGSGSLVEPKVTKAEIEQQRELLTDLLQRAYEKSTA